MNKESKGHEWVVCQGFACVWVQAPSAEAAVRRAADRLGHMGARRDAPEAAAIHASVPGGSELPSLGKHFENGQTPTNGPVFGLVPPHPPIREGATRCKLV